MQTSYIWEQRKGTFAQIIYWVCGPATSQKNFKYMDMSATFCTLSDALASVQPAASNHWRYMTITILKQRIKLEYKSENINAGFDSLRTVLLIASYKTHEPTRWPIKNVPLLFLRLLWQMWIDCNNSFTLRSSSKNGRSYNKSLPPCLESAAALPWEILMWNCTTLQQSHSIQKWCKIVQLQ